MEWTYYKKICIYWHNSSMKSVLSAENKIKLRRMQHENGWQLVMSEKFNGKEHTMYNALPSSIDNGVGVRGANPPPY